MPRPVHELAPQTGRRAWLLSTAYGYGFFRGASALAESLPADATVADLGAGASSLGSFIAKKRPDAQVVHADLEFGHRAFNRHVKHKNLPNLHFVQADVLHMPFRPHSFDRVFSSALLPHIIMTSRETGLLAVHAMASLLKEDGMMEAAGFANLPRYNAISITGAEYAGNPHEVATEVVDFLQLPPFLEKAQRKKNMGDF
ncbi:MAG TPA: class I SAM-dependent methyltransferase [Candidatus Saccharimonadales bacterium]|nr:class I SAM-dependent methyltransferase [Candidatus Saccharimonadales bacterium]